MKLNAYRVIFAILATTTDANRDTILTLSIKDPRPVKPLTYYTATHALRKCEECFITRIESSKSLLYPHHYMVRFCEKTDDTTCDANVMLLALYFSDVSDFQLPTGLGYRIGSTKRYIQLMVHFITVENANDERATDMWIKIHITDSKQRQLNPVQPVWLSDSDFIDKSHRKTFIDVSCVIPKGVSLRITNYNTFIGNTGLVTTGYLVKNCRHKCKWNLIGKVDPKQTQKERFIPVENKLLATTGDIMALRCYFPDGDSNTEYSSFNKMCNFVILAVIEDESTEFIQNYCTTPLNYTWNSDHHLNNIPTN